MKRLLIYVSLLVLINTTAKAQRLGEFLPTPFTGYTQYDLYAGVEGKPYLNDTWEKGVFVLKDGTSLNYNKLKFDRISQQLLLKTSEGKIVTLSKPVKEFRLLSRSDVFRNGYNGKRDYYEVLSDGTIQLLKSTLKDITQITYFPYGTSVEKKVTGDDRYYIFKNGRLINVKPNTESILTAIGDKQAELSEYIKTNHIDLNKDSDLGQLVTYYNSI